MPTERPLAVVRPDAVRTSGLSPLREDLHPEVRTFVAELRGLFEALQIPVRRYAALCHRDPGAVSRYLSGERLPKRPFLDELLAELAATKGAPATAEVRTHLLDLYFRALRARDGGAYQVEVIRDQLHEATITLRQTMIHLRSLEQSLDARQREVDELTQQLRDMEQAWAADRIRSQEELERQRARHEELRQERERLQDHITTLLEQLQWAQNRQAEAEERCQELEDVLQAAEWTYAPPAGPAITSPTATEKVWCNVPLRYPGFTGRDNILLDLAERLRQPTSTVRQLALLGMGGVGKTEIAMEYIHRHAEEHDLVCWISADYRDQIQQAFVDLAAQLGLKTGHEIHAVRSVIEILKEGRRFRNWLLVFDGAHVVEMVSGFFPGTGSGTIILTSRNQAWADTSEHIDVGVFTRQETRALLRDRKLPISDEQADQLGSVLGDLPLVIDQAATLMRDSRMPHEEYLRRHEENRRRWAQDDIRDVPEMLPAAWGIAVEVLRDNDPGALQLLQLCAFLAPEPASLWLISGVRNVDGPADLLSVLGDETRLGQAMRMVHRYGLAKVSYQTGRIWLPRMLSHFLISQLTVEDARLLRHCVHQILTNADPRDPSNPAQWARYAELLPHVRDSGMIECGDDWSRRLVLNEIDFLYHWGDHEGSLKLAEKTVGSWTPEHGEADACTLSACLRLGRGLRTQGQFHEAYEQHLKVCDRLAARFGPEDERTLDARMLLAADLRFLGRYQEALAIDQASWRALQRRFGDNDPLTLQQAHLYAVDLRLTGHPLRAAELDRETYARKSSVLGAEHMVTLASRTNQAVDALELGQYEQARQQLRQIVQRLSVLVHDDQLTLVENLSLLSAAERHCGSYAQALDLSSAVMSSYERRYGIFYSGRLKVELNHAINLRHVGDFTAALRLNDELIERHGDVFGPDHPNTLAAMVNQAVVLRLIGRPLDAELLNVRALEALGRTLGPEHPYTLKCAMNLASDRFTIGLPAEASEGDQALLALITSTLGPDHPLALACTLNHLLDLRAQGHPVEDRFAEITIRYRRVLGKDHPETALAAHRRRANSEITPIPL